MVKVKENSEFTISSTHKKTYKRWFLDWKTFQYLKAKSCLKFKKKNGTDKQIYNSIQHLNDLSKYIIQKLLAICANQSSR